MCTARRFEILHFKNSAETQLENPQKLFSRNKLFDCEVFGASEIFKTQGCRWFLIKIFQRHAIIDSLSIKQYGRVQYRIKGATIF